MRFVAKRSLKYKLRHSRRSGPRWYSVIVEQADHQVDHKRIRMVVNANKAVLDLKERYFREVSRRPTPWFVRELMNPCPRFF